MRLLSLLEKTQSFQGLLWAVLFLVGLWLSSKWLKESVKFRVSLLVVKGKSVRGELVLVGKREEGERLTQQEKAKTEAQEE